MKKKRWYAYVYLNEDRKKVMPCSWNVSLFIGSKKRVKYGHTYTSTKLNKGEKEYNNIYVYVQSYIYPGKMIERNISMNKLCNITKNVAIALNQGLLQLKVYKCIFQLMTNIVWKIHFKKWIVLRRRFKIEKKLLTFFVI